MISVLNYNNFLSTQKMCSLIKHLKKEEEIFIVDNNSTDNSFIKLRNEFF